MSTVSDYQAIAEEANKRMEMEMKELELTGSPPSISGAMVRVILEVAQDIATPDGEREDTIRYLQEILDGSLRSPVFRENPKYRRDGVPRLDYNDVMSNKYIIKCDRNSPASGGYWCDENAAIIAEYSSIEALVDDGWRLD
jgi:hypothetical protein